MVVGNKEWDQILILKSKIWNYNMLNSLATCKAILWKSSCMVETKRQTDLGNKLSKKEEYFNTFIADG